MDGYTAQQGNVQNCNILYMGNLDKRVTENIIVDIFKNSLPQIKDKVVSCKMVVPNDVPGSDPFCFVEFVDNQAAFSAMSFMNGREIFGKKVKVNWATNSGSRSSGSRAADCLYSIFVGDLDHDVDDELLLRTFRPFGDITNVRVVRDANGTSKGYGFVSFKNKMDAENAKQGMHGHILGAKTIRTNWACRSNKGGQVATGTSQQSKLNYNDVYQQASITNCTVYVGRLPTGVTDEQLRNYFSEFGDISDTRIFMDKGYAFVKFMNHESAATAICKRNGEDFLGSLLRCWWGKENQDMSCSVSQQPQQPAAYQMPYNPYNNLYQYWASFYAQQQQQQLAAAGVQPSSVSQQGSGTGQGYMPVMPQTNAQYFSMYPQTSGYGAAVSVVPGATNYSGGQGGNPQGSAAAMPQTYQTYQPTN